jgi:hypothetical protein
MVWHPLPAPKVIQKPQFLKISSESCQCRQSLIAILVLLRFPIA